jgi:hypothetical protein
MGKGDPVQTKRRQAKTVSRTAKGVRTRAEEQSRVAVRQSEMAGLRDFYEVPDGEVWDLGAGNGRGSRRT